MNRRSKLVVGCLAAVLTLSACSASKPVPEGSGAEPPPASTAEAPVTSPAPEAPAAPAAQTQVTGTVLYRERIALSPAAVVKVELVEGKAEGGEGTVLAEQTLTSPGQVPIAFSVSVVSERIRPEGSYFVRARIEDGGRVFSAPAPVPVLTQGHRGSDVQVMLRSGG